MSSPPTLLRNAHGAPQRLEAQAAPETPAEPAAVDLPALRKRLAVAQGRDYWRSLEELANTAAFQELLQAEFPLHASEWPAELGRRDFLHLIAAGLALGGLSACTKQPPEEIVPYVRQPEAIVPGNPLFFATAMPRGGIGIGLLVESHEGRPTKVEGNPDHPDSLGSSDLHSQASVLGLYDPDRSQTVIGNGEVSSWAEFLNVLYRVREAQLRTQGAGLRLLTDSVSSPTLLAQIRGLLGALPAAKWHVFEPVNRDASLLGGRMAFGTDVEPIYRFDRAQRVLSIDADFLSCGPGSLRYTRDFSSRRRPESGPLLRLYAIETTPSNTGMVADHRLRLRPSEVESVVRLIASGLGIEAGAMPAAKAPHAEWVQALVRDLRAYPGASLVVVGDSQPPHVHALVHAMNFALSSVGRTVDYIDPVAPGSGPRGDSLKDLVADLDAGRVDTLLILDSGGGANPAYATPADLRFAKQLEKARLRLHFGPYFDETAALCQWHAPAAHYLESWSDVRAYDGTVSIVQPLIAPLYAGRTAHEVLAALTDQPERSAYSLVRSYWQGFYDGPDFEHFWRQALDRGIIAGTAFNPKQVALRPLSIPPMDAQATAVSGLEVVFRPDPAVYDGRFANNGWLQEFPRPLTRLTWDNVALLSPRTAQRLGAKHTEGFRGKEVGADIIEIELEGRTLRAPVWIQPGQPDECITLTLGYGRSRAGRVGSGVGYNAYALRTSKAMWSARGALVRKTGKRYVLGSTQLHFSLEGRALVRSASLDEYRKEPRFAHRGDGEKTPPRPLSLYPDVPYTGYAWGMAIDLSACVGCGACVLACQAENNIPVVGKEQVVRGRQMHWLRVDLYHKGSAFNPEGYFQPVPCMHCENAPCEPVCPVAATVHSAEGLNDMVYNRCIGTRYCQNNCPYKVRRFNFLLYWNSEEPELMQRNPNVTVRSRGVMEKCTYCVQRITAGRIRSEEEGRRIRDGEVKTACQTACPAGAIIFGDINDLRSQVAELKRLPRNYEMLGELNTRPRTTYLAAVRNPNPELLGV